MERTCRGWGDQPSHEVDESEFYPDIRRNGGLSYLCRECHKAAGREYQKAYYPAHATKHKAAVTERRRERKREQKELVGVTPRVPLK